MLDSPVALPGSESPRGRRGEAKGPWRRSSLALLAGRVLLAGAVSTFVFTGCTTYRFTVDAVRHPDLPPAGPAYEVVTSNPEIDPDAPIARRAEGYVKTALSSKGLYEAPEGTAPNMQVEVDFGMDPPRREVRTHMEPVYRIVPGERRTYSYTVTDENGKTRVVTEVVQDPPREVLVGWREIQDIYILYPKYLRITARETPDQAGDRPPRELWSIYVTNEDEGKDLEQYLPLMVSAAMDSIGQDSTSEKKVVLSNDDERVVFVKRGM